MTNWAHARAMEQVAIARREGDYRRARKWLTYARAFRKVDQLQELYRK